MKRVAAIDCGTNTIKLLIADLSAQSGEIVELVREARMVRLGQDVDRTGRLADEALVRVFAAIDEYAALISGHQVASIRFGATSAARDASNAEVFRAGVTERLGVAPEVLSGEEEAELSFAGATRGLGVGSTVVAAPYLVLDIGGGSTELILGGPDGVHAAHSLDIGSVRMTERHLHSDPPTESEIAAAIDDVDGALDRCRVDPAAAATVIGVAGTVTTTAAGVLGMDRFDADALHLVTVPADGVRAQTAAFLAASIAQRRGLGYMHPGRADVIGAGALILDRVLRRAETPSLLVSRTDILDGIAWSQS